MGTYEKRKRFIVNAVFYAMIGMIVFLACQYILPALMPFVLAFLVATLIQIPVKKIGGQSRSKQRIATIIFCCLFYMVFFLLVIFFGMKLLQGAWDMVVSAPAIYNDRILPVLGEAADRIENVAASVDAGLSQNIEKMFRDFTQNVGQYITDLSVKAVKLLSGGAAKIPGAVVTLVVTVVATFFMALEFDSMTGFVKKCIPAEKEHVAGEAAHYVKNLIFIYLKAYSFLFLLTFLELLLGFLVLRIPYAPVLALAIAVFDILPVLGTGGILLPWAAVLCLMGNVPLAIGLLVLYIIITVIRNTLEPKIVGKQIGLPPLAALISMFVGLKVFGIVGMVAFPVALSVITNLEKNGVIHIFAKKKEN